MKGAYLISAALTAAVLAANATAAVREFRYEDGESVYPSYRTWEFEVDAPGLYVFEIGSDDGKAAPAVREWLDGVQIGYVLNGGDWKAKTARTPGRLRRFRWLGKGKYRYDLYLNVGGYNWNDDMERAMAGKGVRATMERPEPGEAGFWMPDDCMARIAGEPLVVYGCAAGDSNTEAQRRRGTKFTMEVRASREGTPVWSQTLDIGTKPVEFGYPCPKEGAFEYVIKNAQGEVVEGPWAFAVTAIDGETRDSSFSRTSRDSGNSSNPIIVDSVLCTESAGGEHHFREGGRSEIVETPDGAYRITGGNGVRRNSWRKKDPETGAWTVPAKENEKGAKKFRTHDWFAYTLKVANPGKSHALSVRVPNDARHLAHVVVYDRRTGRSNAWGIDSGDAPASGPWSEMKIPFWSNADAIDVMVINTDGVLNSHVPHPNRRGAVAEMSVLEYPNGFPAIEEPAIGWNRTRNFGWSGEQIDLGPHERTMPRLSDEAAASVWKTGSDTPYSHGPALSWGDFVETWERTFELEAWRGGTVVMFPVFSYSMCTFQGRAQMLVPAGYDRYTHQRSGARRVDPFDRDEFALMLQRARKHGVKLVADLMITRTSPHVAAAWCNSYGVSTNGFYLVASADGRPYRPAHCVYSGMLNPAHPAARAVQIEFCREFGRRYGRYASFAGIRHRFWNWWPSSFEPWFCDASTGFDDFTVGEFCKATGIALPPVGNDEASFDARKKRLVGELAREWEAWRVEVVRSLQEKMLAALREGAPNARFYVDTPTPRLFSASSGLDPETMSANPDLGFGAGQASITGPGVEINHLDPVFFKNFWIHDPIGHGRPLRPPTGLCCNSSYRCAPYNLEPAALALADNRLDMLWAGGMWCLPPLDDALRAFARAYRAIPDRRDWQRFDFSRKERKGRKEFEPIAVWWAKDGDDVLFWAVNRTDANRRVVLAFDKEPSALVDCVTGNPVNPVNPVKKTQSEISLAPFMPGVFRAKGAAAIVSFNVPVDADEKAQIERDYAFIASIGGSGVVSTQVAAAVETAQSAGETYFAPAGQLGKRDCRWTFDDLFKPMREARDTGDLHTLRALVADFKTNHRWWYEAFGWPDDFCVTRTVGRGPLVGFLRQSKRTEMWFGETNGVFTANFTEKFPQCKKDFVCAPKGVALDIWRHGNPGGFRQLELTALFGGGYGDIRIEDGNGKLIGVVKASPFSRLETRILSVPIPNPGHRTHVRLVGTGEKGLAIYALGFTALPPKPIAAWQVVGPFDKGGGEKDKASYEIAFPPETEPFDPAAAYAGIGGETIRWKTVALGPGERVMDVAAATPCDLSKMNCVTYLRATVNAPRKMQTVLRYCNDYYGAIWLNGKKIVPAMRGPSQKYDSIEITLRKGENVILVKTSPGSAGTWHFGMAVDDCGVLKTGEAK